MTIDDPDPSLPSRWDVIPAVAGLGGVAAGLIHTPEWLLPYPIVNALPALFTGGLAALVATLACVAWIMVRGPQNRDEEQIVVAGDLLCVLFIAFCMEAIAAVSDWFGIDVLEGNP